jgi:hypothetical protein
MDRRAPRSLSGALALLAGLLPACAALRIETAEAPAPLASGCGPPIDGSEPLRRPGAVTLIGEIPGTDEIPTVFGQLACQAASTGETVLVGLQLRRADQQAIERLLAERDDARARRGVLALASFTAAQGSAALANLLLQLRRWRAEGLQLEVVAFGIDAADPEQRELAMAQTLGAAITARPGATVLVLADVSHVRVLARDKGESPRDAMGVHMLAAHPQLRALDPAVAGGSFWVCMGFDDESADCRARRLGGRDRGATPFVEHAPTRRGPVDGILYYGRVTASPPAVPGPR